jgi:heptose I phosphotransferase
LRFALTDDAGVEHVVYAKRHTPSPWREYVKPLLQGRWPTLGARVEWDAILAFQQAGLPTMTPVAMGESRGNSWLLTAALEPSEKLSEVYDRLPLPARGALLREVAGLARRMHDAGLHHQDFYLGHLLRLTAPSSPVHVIDLGRVQRHSRWTVRRWIVKDLAQLNFSAGKAGPVERVRFLRAYLGRPLRRADKSLARSILHKTARIRAHSLKNGL